jgi:anti-anti-sigma factor
MRDPDCGTLSCMDELKIESTIGSRAGVRVLRLSGAFTLQSLFDFQSIVRGLSDPVLIVDLTEVPYMDSASLGALMTVHTTSQRNKRLYALVGATERVRTLFHVAGVDGILVTYPTLEGAQDALAAKAAAN